MITDYDNKSNMKTIRKGDQILRVKDEEAEKKVNNGYEYIPKSVWKEEVRKYKVKKEPEKKTKRGN